MTSKTVKQSSLDTSQSNNSCLRCGSDDAIHASEQQGEQKVHRRIDVFNKNSEFCPIGSTGRNQLDIFTNMHLHVIQWKDKDPQMKNFIREYQQVLMQ